MVQRRLREVEAALRDAQAEVAGLKEIRASQAGQLRESAVMLDRQRASLEAVQRSNLGRHGSNFNTPPDPIMDRKILLS